MRGEEKIGSLTTLVLNFTIWSENMVADLRYCSSLAYIPWKFVYIWMRLILRESRDSCC